MADPRRRAQAIADLDDALRQSVEPGEEEVLSRARACLAGASGCPPDPAAVLEPVAPSDFPETLVPRLARVQGLLALAREDRAEGERRLAEAIAGWERLLARSLDADSVIAVLADLGRPVVGLVEPERELARVRADLQSAVKGDRIAVIS